MTDSNIGIACKLILAKDVRSGAGSGFAEAFDAHGDTALHIAARYGVLPVVEALVAHEDSISMSPFCSPRISLGAHEGTRPSLVSTSSPRNTPGRIVLNLPGELTLGTNTPSPLGTPTLTESPRISVESQDSSGPKRGRCLIEHGVSKRVSNPDLGPQP